MVLMMVVLVMLIGGVAFFKAVLNHLQSQNVISPEDFAIAPYEVSLGSEGLDTLHYRCILDRDSQNKDNDNIVAKQAVLPSF